LAKTDKPLLFTEFI